MIHCIKKRDDISQEEFRDYWNSEKFDDLRAQIATATGAIQFSKSLTFQIDANVTLRQARGSAVPFDGVIEYFWNDGASLMDIYALESTQIILNEMNEYQKPFVDFANSTGFFT